MGKFVYAVTAFLAFWFEQGVYHGRYFLRMIPRKSVGLVLRYWGSMVYMFYDYIGD